MPSKTLPNILRMLLSSFLVVSAVLGCSAASPLTPVEEAKIIEQSWLNATSTDRAGLEIQLANLFRQNPQVALAAIKNNDQDKIRAFILKGMALAGHPDFSPAILGELRRPNGLHTQALVAATMFGTPDLAHGVYPFLKSSNPKQTALAIGYFQRQPKLIEWSKLVPLLSSKEIPIQSALLGLLPHFPRPESQKICRVATSDKALEIALGGVDCLETIARNHRPQLQHEKAEEALMEAFNHASPDLKPAIVHSLGIIAPKKNRIWLEDLLEDKNMRVALAALIVLQRFESPKTVPVLMKLIEKKTTILPRRLLIKSLGLTHDPRAVIFLGSRLKRGDVDQEDIQVLIEAMGDLGRLEGQTYLLPYLNHRNEIVREKANNALQRIAARQLN